MAWSLLTHTIHAGAAAVSTTTAAINTIGAGLLVVCVLDYNNAGAIALGSVTDSASNAWTQGPSESDSTNSVRTTIFFCPNPKTSASHTVTYTAGANVFAVVDFGSLSGGFYPGSVLDKSSTATSGGPTVSTLALGSITPAANNELIVSGITFGAANSAVSVNSGTVEGTVVFTSGTTMGGASAYFFQTTAAAINSTFSWTTAVVTTGAVASFFGPIIPWGFEAAGGLIVPLRYAAVGGSPT